MSRDFFRTIPGARRFKRHVNFTNLSSGSDSLTLKEDEIGIIVQANQSPAFINLFDEPASSSNGILIRGGGPKEQFELPPGSTIRIQGDSIDSVLYVTTFKVEEGSA